MPSKKTAKTSKAAPASTSSTNKVKKLSTKKASTKKKATTSKRPTQQDLRATMGTYDDEEAKHHQPPMKADPANTSPFLRLPGEIRTEIYFYASKMHNMHVSCPELRVPSGWNSTTQARPEAHEYTLHNLLRVNRQLHSEVIYFMHKRVPVSVELNTPCTRGEFGSDYGPLGYGGMDDIYDDFDYDVDGGEGSGELSDAFDMDTDDEEEYGLGYSRRQRPDGPTKRELKKWQQIEVHAYRGGGDYCASIADDLRGFLKWIEAWDVPAGGSIMLHSGSFFMYHPMGDGWDYRCLKEINTWLKKQKPEKVKQIKLAYCKPLRQRVQGGLNEDEDGEDVEIGAFKKFKGFLKTNEALIVEHEQC